MSLNGRSLVDDDVWLPILLALWLGGASITGHALRCLWLGWRSTWWPRAPGRVIEIRVEMASGSRGSSYEAPHIRYRYEVDGRELEGTAFRVNDFFSRGSLYPRVVELYPSGRRVNVAYDPADPERAFLEPGIPWDWWVVLVIGTLIVGIASALLRHELAMGPVLPGR